MNKTDGNDSSSSSLETGVKIVCIGGGFAGLDVLRTLRSQHGCSVTLLEKRSYHEYLPGIPEVLAEGDVEKLLVPFKGQRNTSRIELVHDILSLDPNQRVVKFKSTDKSERSITFDYAVICTGCDYASPIRGSSPIVSGRVSEVASIQAVVSRTKLPILVAGGGHVGVELAADIASRRGGTQVVLATGNGGVLPGHSEWQVKYVKDFFGRLTNVQVHEERCEEITPTGEGTVREFKLLKSGSTIRTECYFSCTGFGTPNTGFLAGVSLGARGHVSTDSGTLQVKMSDGTLSPCVFAAGDVRNKESGFRMASFAHFEGEFVGRQILRAIRGERLRTFKPPPERSFVVSLGPFDGFVSVLGRSVLWGRVVPWLKKVVEWGWLKVTPYLPAVGFDGKLAAS
ncbi:hypothetical protein TrCOL_g215 [Triparma columacea]|uniref:FAD/NAD(P)-binding domain-containing protein n=1 Tax=Triparma columacea TaxID=722753 RepID=A0A9W7G433_9STRA|nr:hypothetical protein TrCOL_g215 [Triparma columacea]